MASSLVARSVPPLPKVLTPRSETVRAHLCGYPSECSAPIDIAEWRNGVLTPLLADANVAFSLQGNADVFRSFVTNQLV